MSTMGDIGLMTSPRVIKAGEVNSTCRSLPSRSGIVIHNYTSVRRQGVRLRFNDLPSSTRVNGIGIFVLCRSSGATAEPSRHITPEFFVSAFHDPGDDAILEAAIAGACGFVVSFNEWRLRAAREFDIEILKPSD